MNIPRKLRNEFQQWMVYVYVVLFFILVVFLFKINVVGVVAAIGLMIIASFSKIYKKFTSISFGFELITPVTILFAYKIDILFSLLAAVLMLIAASFISTRIDFAAIFIEVIVYIILAVLTALMRGVPFVPLAVAMIVLRNILLWPLGAYILGRDFVRLLIVVVTDVVCNVLIVIKFGDFFAGLF